MNPQESKKLENALQKTLLTYLKPQTTVIAGISGGPDSIFLLLRLLEAQKRLSNLKIVVAHVNHRLRGKESDKDEEFVKKLVESYTPKPPLQSNLLFTSKSLNIKSLSQKSKKGLEETARKARYNYFKQLAKKHNATYVLTAHHADDNLETILLNLTRGATLQGLSGMQELDALPFSTSKTTQTPTKRPATTLLLRPLLAITKKQIIDYLKQKNTTYRTDKSNQSNEFNRNLIRNSVLPHLLKINPNLATTTAKNSKNIREINAYLKEKAQHWIKKNVQSKSPPTLNLNENVTKVSNARRQENFDRSVLKSTRGSKFFDNAADDTFVTFSTKPFLLLHPTLQKQILFEIHTHLIGNAQNLENTHIEEVLTLITQNIGNKRKKFGKLLVSLKNNILTIKPSI